ncbi:unnamed protein product [Callosobruchus maculatus]|uniref:PHD-type domain-containing protein n=1 Tax=Callosobruchus maculatus TaxID=64391 RepID=A0A653D7V1_CALMS|nr:unnamed protein product [Callosobruchus maculatus]
MANKKAKIYDCEKCKGKITKSHYSIRCAGNCQKWFHKKCTGLTDAEFLLFEKSSSANKWICSNCSNAKILSSSSESDSSDDASINSASLARSSSKRKSLQKRRDKKGVSVEDNPSNKEIMEFMSARFAELEENVKFTSGLLDDLQVTISTLVKENASLKKEQKQLKSRVDQLKKKQRNVNAVIVGLGECDVKQNVKKVFNKLEYQINEEEYRIQVLNSKSNRKPVLVGFRNEEAKKRLIEARRKVRRLTSQECGIAGVVSDIYINEDLSREYIVRVLFSKDRTLKNHQFKYVWCKNDATNNTSLDTPHLGQNEDIIINGKNASVPPFTDVTGK